MSTVSIIGAGLLGSAIARQLHQSGYHVGVWNFTSARAPHLSGLVTRIEDRFTDAVHHGDVIIFCVSDYAAADALISAADTTLAGRDVVNLSTGSAEDARRFERLITEAGGHYLDGANAAYPADNGEAATVINLSGISAEDIDESLVYWITLLASKLRHCMAAIRTGDHGTDQATLTVYLAAVRSWRDTMIGAGQRSSLLTANLHNLELAAVAGLGAEGISAQGKTAAVAPAGAGRTTNPGVHP